MISLRLFDGQGFAHAQRDNDVKTARVARNGRRHETACLRLLAMREFDRWGRRGPVEGPHRFKIAASTFLDRKIIQEKRIDLSIEATILELFVRRRRARV